MSQPVDELFGHGEGAPRPRIARVLGLLGAGLVLSVLGFGCTVVPGAGLVMLAWFFVEKDMDRVENGFLPLDTRPTVARLRNATRAVVLATVLLLVLQFLLVSGGTYDALLLELLRTVPSPFAAPPAAP